MSDTIRKPYTSPRVIVYGHVKDIVQGSTGSRADTSNTTRQTGGCWIADALYGVEDPRTLVLRAWLSGIHAARQPGWRFVALYARFGRGIADAIARGGLPRTPFVRLFDRLSKHSLDHQARALRHERTRRTT